MVCLDTKIAIIGAGHVGSTLAYTCMLQEIATQIALIDINKDRAAGEAMDMNHCLQFAPHCSVVAGDSFELVAGATVVIITAGAAQRPGQTRLDLLEANVKLFKQMVPQITRYNQDCFLLVVTNPMDVLTYISYKLSGFPSNRVIGSGTVLDTARLRFLLARYFELNPKDLQAYVLGEHGDSEFIWWSGAAVAGSPLNKQVGFDLSLERKMLEQTRRAAYEIIEQKGATYYAIALAVAKIIKSLMFNQSRIFTVSTLYQDKVGDELYVSLPVVLAADGAHRRLSLTFSLEEEVALQQSVEQIKKGILAAQKVLNSA